MNQGRRASQQKLQRLENVSNCLATWWLLGGARSLVAIGVICWQLPTSCALPCGGKQFKVVGEGSGLYRNQTPITPEDQSLNQIAENCSLRGSSKGQLSRGVAKLANSIGDSTLTKKKNIETEGPISKQFKGMCYICLPSVASTSYVTTLLE